MVDNNYKSFFMNETFGGLSRTGILRPGENYILVSFEDQDLEQAAIGELYLIRTEQEFLEALDMENRMLPDALYELMEFRGLERISDDCYRVIMVCFEFGEETDYSLYLHRVKYVEEKRKAVMEGK